ncbi:MAG: cysteine--tRNA ligase [Micrococcales bacterium]|nr:cysteine--tRNA ligase [Micrococcales bacterium]MCL2668941.1 cysteine--tRNA ligase [Micrococcales bacterium]
MSLHLFDSATHAVRPFEPLVPGKVGIYLCGATVQSAPHIGHLRAALAFDVLVRWLRRTGHEVTVVRNVTDIDDKILAKAAEAKTDWWAWAYTHERAFTAAYDAVGLLPPTYEPRATGHVPEMVELMQLLIERGHAYVAGSGEVWFDVRSWPAYGELTNQNVDDMKPAPDATDGVQKRDPADFALWKGAKPHEPATASWDTPFGRGRPGWHLECSAMARRYLGDEFDIHAGGLDLRFPHHENEQAQSRAAGFGFAQLWMHNGWVTQSGEKMSKSLGNGLLVSELLAHTPAVVLRYALVTARYRSMLEWGESTLSDAAAAWERLSSFVERASTDDGTDLAEVTLPRAFVTAMDDDLDVAAALAVVHETLRVGNTSLAEGRHADAAESALSLRAMLDVLGLDPVAWRTTGDARAATALDALVTAELDARSAARAARDFAAADAIRDRLNAAGVAVEDSPDGSRWSLA